MGGEKGWAVEDAVMRQGGTEGDGGREYDDIPREERLIELASLPSPPLLPPSLTPSSLMHVQYTLEPQPHALVHSNGSNWAVSIDLLRYYYHYC